MRDTDLNLLVALQALIESGSVAEAARRLKLSPSAMSRTLTRLREQMNDPLLVRAGGQMQLTQRARELEAPVREALEAAQAILRPQAPVEPHALKRTFRIGCREELAHRLAPALLARLATAAPHCKLHFLPRTDRRGERLRTGALDLELSVVAPDTHPELRTRVLLTDDFVGAHRPEHPLGEGPMSADRYAACEHVEVLRHLGEAPEAPGPIDAALQRLGLERRVVAAVETFGLALRLAADSDLVAVVPRGALGSAPTALASFELPFALPPIRIALGWHPRDEADPGHRWLREQVMAVAAHASPSAASPALDARSP